ncbi:MAG: M28 family peptidase [Phycisphaerales bacterium]|nr:M28 family peptidase [Phycisphaerales bacterium]
MAHPRFRRFVHALLLSVSTAAVVSASACSQRVASSPRPMESAPSRVDAYRAHVVTLSDEKMEGRAPDTRGNRLAAAYIGDQLRSMGLQPAFPAETKGEAGADLATTFVAYDQSFTVRGRLKVNAAEAGYESAGGRVSLKQGTDFNPLGVSANGRAEGPLAFVGYAITDGPDGYSSFGKDDDLTGKVAVVLRFEPMDAKGKSKWGTGLTGWSRRAGLSQKIQAAVERKASAVVLISPPGADDPRAEVLETHDGTRIGRMAGVPVIMLSIEAGNALLKAADPQGRDLLAFRKLADQGGIGAISLSPGVTLGLNVNMSREPVPTTNVGGILRGRGSLADQYVIVGGHYDHVGYGYFGSRSPGLAGKVHPGADDNASGTAGVLIAADELVRRYRALPADADARSIMFLLFSAEEMGLLGADHFVKNSPIESKNIEAMINLDMIGRLRDQKLTVYGTGTAAEWPELVDRFAAGHGLAIEKVSSGIGPSDHAVFHRAGLPVLHLFTGLHPDYHAVTDTADKINFEGGARVAAFTADLAFALATNPKDLTFANTANQAPPRITMPGVEMAPGAATPPPPGAGPTDTAEPVRPQRVRLGIMPASYSEDQPGVPVGEVFPDTPAARAGFKPGDRIIRWGGKPVAGIEEMTAFLQSQKPGDKADIVVRRGAEEVTMTVAFEAPEPPR